MKKKNFARTGIDEDSHSSRCKRVIFAVASIEYFEHASEFGDPLLNGYVVNERMQCVPVRYCKDALPAEIRSTVIAPELEAPGNDEMDDEIEDETEEEKLDLYLELGPE